MNLVTMDYFVALAEERSFTRAALRLSVTQQTLSAHIASLERELRVRLVNRTVPLTLTYAGEEFLGYARRFQAERRALEQEFADIAGDVQGMLAVGVASTRGRIMMPSAIASFSQTHPGVRIQLYEAENDELVERLKEGRLDMLVATMPEKAPGMVVKPLHEERIVLLVADSLLTQLYGDEKDALIAKVEQTGSLAPLSRLPYMLLSKGDEPGDISRAILERSGIRPVAQVMSKNSETLVELAARGVGACFVPSELSARMVGNDDDSGLREIFLGDDAVIPVHIAWRASDHVWSVIGAFAEQLEVLFGEDCS